ncbi:Cadmium resistance transcriptional regulatory protein CadC [bioreactor metagenome]|uniref:Cadmium resistance transcriptional regulatory protein CadC n=1 Tax=bioreactor metagenome TaxID=1076179 RepID=A0A645IK21_9ZZZZ|nr:metalloregulator ArsR/SmtB family transcription factor [Erysipelotrichaceae bacterium]
MDIAKTQKILEILSDLNRIKIIKELSGNKEICACKLLKLVDCKQATLSHHMKLMVNEGIVNARKDGKWVHYSLNKKELRDVFKYIVSPLAQENK